MSNLNFKTSEESLKDHFSSFSPTSAKIGKNEKGRSNGSGFVDFSDKKNRDLSLAFNGSSLDEREIKVEIKKEKPKNERQKGQIVKYNSPNKKCNIFFFSSIFYIEKQKLRNSRFM